MVSKREQIIWYWIFAASYTLHGFALFAVIVPGWWDIFWEWQHGVFVAALIGVHAIAWILFFNFDRDRRDDAKQRETTQVSFESLHGRDELLLLYQDSIDIIRDLKRQQWTMTYYALLLYAAIIGAYSLIYDETAEGFPVDNLLPLFLVIVATMSTIILVLAQFSLRRRRIRLLWMRNYFDKAVEGPPYSIRKQHAYFIDDWPIWGMMVFTIIIGAGVAVGVLDRLARTVGG